MKIFSWNVRWQNRRISDIAAFICKQDFDLFALQEVREELLQEIKKFPYEIAYALDSVRAFGGEHPELLYTVILSRYPILSQFGISYPPFGTSFRTKLFIFCMRPFGWSRILRRGSLFADINTPKGKLRFFSIHLTLAGPSFRKKELAVIESFMSEEMPNILCGDFNIVEHPFIKFISWLLGSPFSESLPNHDERSFFDEWIRNHGLQNPLRGKITHPFSASQLDHVLIPASASATSAYVLSERSGSDHSPVFVEFENLS